MYSFRLGQRKKCPFSKRKITRFWWNGVQIFVPISHALNRSLIISNWHLNPLEQKLSNWLQFNLKMSPAWHSFYELNGNKYFNEWIWRRRQKKTNNCHRTINGEEKSTRNSSLILAIPNIHMWPGNALGPDSLPSTIKYCWVVNSLVWPNVRKSFDLYNWVETKGRSAAQSSQFGTMCGDWSQIFGSRLAAAVEP